MTSSDLLFALPVELACEIVGKWLYLDDVVHLDSAFCNASRTTLHASVFTSSVCIILEAPFRTRKNPQRFVEWALSKHICVSSLHVGYQSTTKTYEEYLQLFGKNIECVRVQSVDGDCHSSLTVMNMVSQHCRNLDGLTFRACTLTTELLNLLSASLNLEMFRFDEADGFNYGILQELLAIPATHHLKVKAISLDCDELAEACVFKMCDPACVTRMTAPASRDMLQWSQLTNLRSLGFCSDSQLDDERLLHILSLCPWVTNLDLSGSEEVSSAGVQDIAPIMHNLHTINLENLYGLTSVGLTNIVQHHKCTLTALYVHGCSYLSAEALNHVVRECTHLHTISYSSYDADYSLMSNITTLITDFYKMDVWSAVHQHCRKLQHLHVVLKYNQTARETIVGQMTAIRDSLPVRCNLSYVDLNRVLKQPERTQLQQLRRAASETCGDWYSLFKLPVS